MNHAVYCTTIETTVSMCGIARTGGLKFRVGGALEKN